MTTGETNATKAADQNNDQIISYLTLRSLIGATGLLLPLLVVIGKFISEGSMKLEFSISDYYDNGTAGDILVGILFVLGFFLATYKGPDVIDSRAANLGCFCSLGVALCPTTYCYKCWAYYAHFCFAITLFAVFIFFSLYLFRKKKKGATPTKKKEYRNRIYLVCGIIMIACIAGIAAAMIFVDSKVTGTYHLVYWFESIALVSFGVSWITKSESFYLKD